ncbi:bifunctional sugar phosphate isomerase/epimerase/4-hydroxyphenylpyruvate dioxygenase family protein [Azohydromonas caseinilytica]|uniref:3-dehydroshikimate dehydratase n=1 Tax=Azohydromonas caseinilytica TaxID=2728836 RepID=A0A848F8R7_9BURK|nr:sugar phosphate isomerase/epimerase and 4-hydroxyphenylpyruvate domain-containing protein [Azohydromonas caseinilytica]NML15752.1 sugar phosphate isomerase/epimerase and 4-hydroxyphenylpyruvate domain-containing protein [Azohydromonas caseinilytica]
MRRSIATVSLSGTLRDKLQAIAAARFDGIELFEPDFTNARMSAAELRTQCEDLGLRIELFQPFRDFEGMPQAAFERSLERAEKKFDLMEALGCPLMLVCSNTSPLALPDPALAAEQLRALAERAARRNLRIGFEALAWGRHVKLWRQAWDIVQRVDHPHLGLIVDSFHTFSLKDSPQGIADVGEKLFFVQMADAPLMGLDVIDWARHHRNFPGQGQFDVVGFFEQCVRAGYSGPLSLEIFNDVFRATPNRRIAVDAMRSLLWLEGEVRHRLEQAGAQDAAAAQLLQRQELFDPPPVPAFNGVSFIEFAVDGAHAESLGELLRQLGFQFAGRHRSKAVTLFRQGGIRIVLNQQATSAARERFSVQGPSVCALGLRTGDPVGALNRATALQSARYEAPTGAGEQRLPSIVSPGGVIVHFVDEALGENGLFEKDFILEAEDGAAGAGLQAIDHLAIGLTPDRLDTWVLFCRAVLGLDAADAVKFADPFGLIRSTGMSDAARRLRLVLNMSMSERTRMAQAAQASGGVGVQHIAFASGDLLASVERLKATGLRFVPISDNYYDDLPTRFELDAAFVERLRAAGILFDRSAQGDYLHAYTEPYAGAGFFFELVQRLDDYDGYGAVNAPARMASQAQEERQ